jgi:gliding motility-associated-like protein
MKKYILFVLIAFTVSKLKAQSWNWALKLGDIKSDKATTIKTDDSGYIYVAGYFSNQLQIGTNLLQLNYVNNATSKEIYIAKFDSLGYCYWAKSGGAYYDDRILGMDVDSAGNSVITGTFWEGSGIDLDGTIVTGSAFGSNDQCFIYKLDRLGNVMWGTFVCGDNTTPSGGNYKDDQGFDVATDKFGNSYVVGFMTTETLYCGGNIVTATNPNNTTHKHCYWLTKINANGVFQWAKTFGHLPWDISAYKYIERDLAVCVDEKDGVYITGGYDSTRSFGNTTLTTKGGYDIFVLKYDSNGNYKWASSGGSRKDDWSNGICSDKNGFIYITGEFRDSLILDTLILKNYNGRDAFVIKMDANTGKSVWGKHAGTINGGERGNDIVADKNCNIYICGDIDGGAKFGDNIITPTGKSIESFVARISSDGKWNWVTTGGGTDSNDRANAITKGKNGQIYTCGSFRSPADFGITNLVSTGKSDGFIARLYDSMLNKLNPFVLNTPLDSIVCKGDSIVFFITENGYVDYNPKLNVDWNASTNKMILYPVVTTTYTIMALGKGQCPSMDTIVFTINIAPNPIADFDINPQQVLLANSIFTLTNKSINGDTYNWRNNNSIFATTTNTQFIADNGVGTYCFTLTVTSIDKCIDTITKCGDVILLQEVYVPNVFSPNNDSKNEIFNINVTNVNKADILQFNMIIADRFGTEIFKSNNINNGWNGKYNNGDNADIGTYIYYVNLTIPNGKKISKKGDLVLVR